MLEIKMSFDDEYVSDLLCNMFEGGVGYWCVLGNDGKAWDSSREVVKAKNSDYVFEDVMVHMLNNGKAIQLYDDSGEGVDDTDGNDGTEESPWLLTKEKLERGLSLASRNGVCIDIERMDGCDADCILQYALFGEVIFG